MTTKTPAVPQELTITYAPVPGINRKMRVRIPDEGTLAVWAATGARFQQLGQEWAEQSEALADADPDSPELLAFQEQRRVQATRGLSRALTVIQSALIDDVDKDWIEDMLLGQRITLGHGLGVLSEVVNELRRVKATAPAAPTTGPVKKARRAAA